MVNFPCKGDTTWHPHVFTCPPFPQLCEVGQVVSHLTDVETEDKRHGAEPLVSALILVLFPKGDVEAQWVPANSEN